ncbi:hypothetical protein D3C72_2519620 [compost metagenome]
MVAIIVLRIPSIQPPTETSTIDVAGRIRWYATSPRKARENSGVVPTAYAWRSGNQPSVTPKRYSSPIASQK